MRGFFIIISKQQPLEEPKALEWTIDYLEKERIARVRTRGLITWDDTKQMTEEVFSFIRNKKVHRVLVDHREMVPNLSVLQIDNLPAMFREIGVEPEDKIAVLFNPATQNEENLAFFDNVMQITSLQFHSFTDEGEAIAWLKSKD
jgi:hypothetical protein